MTETLSPALPADVEALVHIVLDAACSRNIALATAESCTGGLLASLLTDVERSGRAFERGFVCYSEEAKRELLGIAEQDIVRCGAVSREVAIAMAQGALGKSHADVVLAVTGFAGAAGPDDEEGLVHFACARRGGGITHREAHFGAVGRGAIRIASLRAALEMMRDAMG